jgi:hypothetical protein
MRVLARAWRTRGSVHLAKTRPCAAVCRQLETSSRGIHVLKSNTIRHIGLPLPAIRQTRCYLNPTPRRNGDSTIYALSTAPGRGAIAIIRISGPACLSIYRALCPGKKDPKARHATVRTLYDPTTPPTPSSVLDSGALILYFPAPKTVTGEDLLELHVHGGTAIVRAVLAAIPQTQTPESLVGPIRYAEPGEFTRRAFAAVRRLDTPAPIQPARRLRIGISARQRNP